jgi:ribosomal protein L12E/L44/L45/RPP1/RPP2
MADEIRPSLPTSPVTPAPDDKRREQRKFREQTAESEAEQNRNEDDDDSGNLFDEYV